MLKDFWLDDEHIKQAMIDYSKGDFAGAFQKIAEVDPHEQIAVVKTRDLFEDKGYFFIRNLEKKFPNAKLTKKLFHFNHDNLNFPGNKKIFDTASDEIKDSELLKEFTFIKNIFNMIFAGYEISLISQAGQSYHKTMKSACEHLIKEYKIS